MLEEAQQRELIMKWYDEYNVAIFKYIYKMIHDGQEAEDLMQETFLRVFRYLRLEKEIQFPKTYLYRTARNLTIDHIRKQKPIQLVKELFTAKEKTVPATETVVEIQEELRELQEVVQTLKTSYREVIILRKIEGFTIQETAQILNWTENKVKYTLSRGLKMLDEKLSKGGVINEIF
ncbi:RNA polymerase sigma factor [Caldibacillus lycopersici]|uniref:RNA polymerase sigma factor n=1 Tax=Perspicuibacillus lycopersici TaxID=1325689 RepID=A0AAE3IR33_9BACI|nr:RNA polymerase sigma factor [Perspicuibacillus lycopersici]MCU9613028.1 RNA polymerase sigma factor [Perspicuibacillus lycopersici]